MALSYTMNRTQNEPVFAPRVSMMAPSVAYAPHVAAAPVSMMAPAPAPVAASTNPFALDYAQFQAAMQPYAAANNGAYSWTSPEGQNGSVGLTLANGKTWTPSGAGSGVTFVPKGTPIMVDDPFQVLGGDSGEERRQIQQGVTTQDKWTVSGDMSQLLGLTDTNAHKTIDYTIQGNQLVPVNESDWKYMSPGASFMANAGPALAVFAAAAGGASMLGGAGASSAAGAQAAADAGLAYSGGLSAADAAALSSAVASPVTAGAVEASMLPALAPEVVAPAFGSGLTVASAAPALAAETVAPALAAETALGSGLTAGGASGLSTMGGGTGLLSGSTGLGLTAGAADIGAGLGSTLAGLNTGMSAGLLGGAALGAGSSLAGVGAGMAPVDYGLTSAGTTAAGTAAGGGLLSTIKNGVGTVADALGTTPGALLSGGANLLGGYLNTQAASDAAAAQAAAQIEAARIAADAAKFRPVGVSTRFGTSQFGFDPKTGYLNSAGYTLSPEMKAQQDALMSTSNGVLTQFQNSQAATAPMADAAARMMSLGNQYLATDPQAQAQKYMADQMALLSAGRNTDMAKLQAQMQAQGRGGFSIGGGDGMYASNPQMQALLNAQRQQDLGLAAQATQGGMDYAKFGSGLVGSGGNMLSSMYGTQRDAFAPYQTALGGAQTIEGLGQNALDQGINLGKTSTTANANAGQLLGQGMSNAAGTIGSQAAAAGSTWGNMLQGLAQGSQQYVFNPFTGVKL